VDDFVAKLPKAALAVRCEVTGATWVDKKREACWSSGLILDICSSHEAGQRRTLDRAVTKNDGLDASLMSAKAVARRSLCLFPTGRDFFYLGPADYPCILFSTIDVQLSFASDSIVTVAGQQSREPPKVFPKKSKRWVFKMLRPSRP
jgi:hypothetical protein